MRKRLAVASDRPTGPLHLGHLVGSLQVRAALQDSHHCVFVVDDLRALARGPDLARDVRRHSRELVLDWLAAGLDPSRSLFVLQSLVPEFAAGSFVLAPLCPTSRFLHEDAPLSLASELLLLRADDVPAHARHRGALDLVRDLARRFNQIYGRHLPEPRTLESPDLPGIDGDRMSRRRSNAIYLADPPQEVERRVQALTPAVRARYQELFGEDVARGINALLAPLRERRRAFERTDVEGLLREGSARAREQVGPALEEMRARAGLTPATTADTRASSFHAAFRSPGVDQPRDR